VYLKNLLRLTSLSATTHQQPAGQQQQ
jgi:hypothetical protein